MKISVRELNDSMGRTEAMYVRDAINKVLAEVMATHQDVEQILIDGSVGKIQWFANDESALEYFEDHKYELNEVLADLDMDISNISGMDDKDRLCLGEHNRKAMAQWLAEYGVSIIADWFELEY